MDDDLLASRAPSTVNTPRRRGRGTVGRDTPLSHLHNQIQGSIHDTTPIIPSMGGLAGGQDPLVGPGTSWDAESLATRPGSAMPQSQDLQLWPSTPSKRSSGAGNRASMHTVPEEEPIAGPSASGFFTSTEHAGHDDGRSPAPSGRSGAISGRSDVSRRHRQHTPDDDTFGFTGEHVGGAIGDEMGWEHDEHQGYGHEPAGLGFDNWDAMGGNGSPSAQQQHFGNADRQRRRESDVGSMYVHDTMPGVQPYQRTPRLPSSRSQGGFDESPTGGAQSPSLSAMHGANMYHVPVGEDGSPLPNVPSPTVRTQRSMLGLHPDPGIAERPLPAPPTPVDQDDGGRRPSSSANTSRHRDDTLSQMHQPISSPFRSNRPPITPIIARDYALPLQHRVVAIDSDGTPRFPSSKSRPVIPSSPPGVPAPARALRDVLVSIDTSGHRREREESAVNQPTGTASDERPESPHRPEPLSAFQENFENTPDPSVVTAPGGPGPGPGVPTVGGGGGFFGRMANILRKKPPGTKPPAAKLPVARKIKQKKGRFAIEDALGGEIDRGKRDSEERARLAAAEREARIADEQEMITKADEEAREEAAHIAAAESEQERIKREQEEADEAAARERAEAVEAEVAVHFSPEAPAAHPAAEESATQHEEPPAEEAPPPEKKVGFFRRRLTKKKTKKAKEPSPSPPPRPPSPFMVPPAEEIRPSPKPPSTATISAEPATVPLWIPPAPPAVQQQRLVLHQVPSEDSPRHAGPHIYVPKSKPAQSHAPSTTYTMPFANARPPPAAHTRGRLPNISDERGRRQHQPHERTASDGAARPAQARPAPAHYRAPSAPLLTRRGKTAPELPTFASDPALVAARQETLASLQEAEPTREQMFSHNEERRLRLFEEAEDRRRFESEVSRREMDIWV